MKVYDEVGVRHDIYGFDIYGDEYNSLAELKTELDGSREGKKPVFIEEAYSTSAWQKWRSQRADHLHG